MSFLNIKKRYKGSIAENYDQKRTSELKWETEQETILGVLKQIKSTYGNESLSILDIPVGTGRFFEFYKSLNFNVTGADISEDMIQQSKLKSNELNLPVEFSIEDITNIKMEDKKFDIVLSIRLTNWLSKNDLHQALKELIRLSRKHIVFGVRTYTADRTLRDKVNDGITKLKKAVAFKHAIIIHDEDEMMKYLGTFNLSLESKQLIEKKDKNKGSNYYNIYHFVKKDFQS